MIAVKLWGGVGNQMFQYAFALYMAKNRNDSISFFTDKIGKNLEDFAITNFKLDLVQLSDAKIKSLGYTFRSTFEYRLKRKIIQLFPFLNIKILVEKGLQHKENIPKHCILFDGYWQSHKYVNAVENELREKFIFRDCSLLDLEAYKHIITTNSVSLHIRKGDYLQGKNALIYEACPIDYYIKAIDLISKSIESPVFFVFSNDLQWTKENLKVTTNISLQFVDNSDYRDPAIADLFLMSKCKNNIIANSTFSWWAAWLNDNNDKIVIAPKIWVHNKSTSKDLIPTSWIVL